MAENLKMLFPDFQNGNEVNAKIEKLTVSKDGKEIFLSLFCDKYNSEYLNGFLGFLKNEYNEYDVSLEVFFPREAFCESAFFYVLRRISGKGLPVNGFFNGSKISIDADKIDVELTHGGLKVLENMEFSRIFALEVKKSFGFMPTVSFSGVTEIKMEEMKPITDDAPTASEKSTTAHTEKPQRAKNALTQADVKNKYLDLEDESYTTVLGKKPSLDAIKPLIEVVGDGGKCTVWGDVFFVDTRETRNKNTVYTVSITDYTSSINIKLFDRSNEYKALGSVAAGDTLVVGGEVAHDRYENEFVLTPYNIIKVNKKHKKDLAERKRIELHLHTNMSTMDGIPSAADAVMRAAEYGHEAVAITDHGVVQAFPDAYAAVSNARKLRPDFKVLFGVECYYVDDSTKAVSGYSEVGIDGEIVCFDLETTGLSAMSDRIIEIGAVRIKNGEIIDSFDTFVFPERDIPERITELTGITDDDVKGAPCEREALLEFFAYAKDLPLMAHNASFDMSFLEAGIRRCLIDKKSVSVDSLAISQALLPDLKKHKLDSLTSHFKLQNFEHHRANDDAAALARIYFKLMPMMKEVGIEKLSDINDKLGGKGYKHSRPNHMILLVKNAVGLKNLYKLVSLSHLEYFHSRPRIPRSELMRYKEGLIIGSACEQGEVYKALVEGKPWEDVEELSRKYDYLEIQPVENNRFMVANGTLQSEDEIREINKQVVKLAKQTGKPVCATCDVHFLDEKDEIYRRILMHGIGFSDAGESTMLTFRTTDEMLEEFSYLGKETAEEVVIDNPKIISDMIESDILPIPKGTFTPSIDGAEETLLSTAKESLHRIFGDNPPESVEARMNKELESIIGNQYSVLYVIAQKLVAKSESDGYHVGSRGSVGSSFIAFLLGISEVNPIAPHYICKKCKYFEFVDDVGSGFDLPDRACPVCGEKLFGDGQDIPFETFLGFKGDKQPDIDLNFSSEYQSQAHRYTEEIFGKDHVFKAGTISALKDKTAYGYVKKYLEDSGHMVSKAEESRLALGCVGVKRTTGQHPGGMVVVPQGYDITDFCPAQHPADKSDADVITTHFDFNSLHDTLLKLDELGHEVPTMYHYIEALTGVNVADIPMNDRNVFKLFTSVEPLGITEQDVDSKTGTFGIPEMGTETVRRLLIESNPQTFADLVQVSGLSHGTDVWANNAQDLIAKNICTIKDVIGTRDSIMTELIKMGVPNAMAFEIMEITRKGKFMAKHTDEHIKTLKENNVPEWYIESCKKIKYMFPKAHAVAYVTSAVRLAWFKLYYPIEFYSTYFTVRGSDIDVDAALGGKEKAKRKLIEMKALLRDDSKRVAKDEDTYVVLQMICEMLSRGYEFLPIDIRYSDATRYLVEDGKLRLPFISAKGVGENAAKSLSEALKKKEYVSAEEMLSEPGVTPSLLDALDKLGALGNLPKTSQLTLF